jgi:hypothetical protein
MGSVTFFVTDLPRPPRAIIGSHFQRFNGTPAYNESYVKNMLSYINNPESMNIMPLIWREDHTYPDSFGETKGGEFLIFRI